MTPWGPPEIVLAAQAGSAASLDALIEVVWPGCYRLAASVLGDASLAEDVAQEACAIVYARIASVREVAAFDAWLYRIVMREASRARRRHRERLDPPAIPRGFAERTSTSLDVWRALSALPSALREVVVLYYFEDLRTHEIANVLRVPDATIRFRLFKARQNLRAVLRDYDDAPIPSDIEVTQNGA